MTHHSSSLALKSKFHALRLRKAAHWAGDTSPHFADMINAAPGLTLQFRHGTTRLEAKTVTGGALLIMVDATHITAERSEVTHSATLRLTLPARLQNPTA